MTKRKHTGDRLIGEDVTRVRREPSAPSRSTFRVARANDLLAATLPHVVYQGRDAVKVSPRKVAARLDNPAARVDIKPMPEKAEPRKRLDLKPLESETCKSRPRRSHGSGGSRAFVPWCSRKG